MTQYESAINLNSNVLLTYFMNQTKILTISAVVVGLIGAISLVVAWNQEANGMYEDQLEVCNFEQVCLIVNADDVMNKTQAEQVWNQFNNELDTYERDVSK